MIIAIHWLRACYKVKLLGSHDDSSLLLNYQGKTGGLRYLPDLLIAGSGHSLATWLTNVIGFFGEFGFSAVSAFIILSGFSLTFGSRDPSNRREWLQWYKKRLRRLLVPFYLTSIPFLSVYGVLLAITSRSGNHLFSELHPKLLSIFPTPLLGVVLSHTLFFNPFYVQFQPTFFAPAWWFIPAILVAYLTYPIVLAAVRSGRASKALCASAIITIASYSLVNAGILINETTYYIVLQESFLFTLGVTLGIAWRGGRRASIERFLFRRNTAIFGIVLFYIGNFANWFPYCRPFASMLYGPGLLLAIIPAAKYFERNRALNAITTRIDAYDLYLVHQPFAFPIAIILAHELRGYTPFVAWFVFASVASIAAFFLAKVTKLVLFRIELGSRSPQLVNGVR